MAVTLDTQTTSQDTFPATSTSRSFSYTVASDANYLLVGVPVGFNATGLSVSSVTYGGEALASLGTAEATGSIRLELWGKATPLTGANTLVVTMSGATTMQVGVSSWKGVDVAGTPVSGYVTGTNFDAAATLTVSSASGDLVVAYVNSILTTTPTVAGGETLIHAPAGQASGWGASYESGAATVAMDWTVGNNRWQMAGISFKAAPTAVTIAPGLGSVPFTGRQVSCGLGIGMPDVP